MEDTGILKELNGYAVYDTDDAHQLVIRGDNAADDASPDLAIGYAVGWLHARRSGFNGHEVLFRNYPERRLIIVRVFREGREE